MKKIIQLLLVFVLAFSLVACDPDKPNNDDNISVTELDKFVKSTKSNYEDASSASILITVKNGSATSTLEYVYNYSGSEIESLMLKYVSSELTMEAYVKDGYDYVNIEGEKTKSIVGSDTTNAILEKYGFNEMTKAAMENFNTEMLNASTVSSDEDGLATLTFDKSKYVVDYDGLDVDEAFEAQERYTNIQNNIKEITLYVTYANKKVTKLSAKLVNNSDVVSEITIEFRGMETQTITYPSDLDSYTDRA